MSSDERIVMTPAQSTVRVDDLNDSALRYVTVNMYKDRNTNTQRPEPTINTVTLFEDFAADPTKVRTISIPVTMRHARGGDVTISAAECRALGHNDRTCPRIRLVSYHDGRPVEAYRVRYQRVLPIPDEGAGIFITAAMTIQPGFLYTISIVDRRTRARTTLTYRFDRFLSWPSDVVDPNGNPVRTDDFGLGEATLVFAVVTNKSGAVSHWISDAYTKRPDAVDRIGRACDAAHAARNTRAYRKYFGRFPDALSVIPLSEDDEHAPEAVQQTTSARTLVTDIIDCAFTLMRDKTFPAYPEGAESIRELRRNVPVGVSMTAGEDGVVTFQACLNAGTRLLVYTAQLTEIPPGGEDAAFLFGGKRALGDLHKTVSDNGGMLTTRCVVTF